ncbi:MAG: peptidylprolyl isomerase [Lachnospiraceae bacterium]|nr:peptidylprolyl isomerase [Lachnospiraceae bacterium]
MPLIVLAVLAVAILAGVMLITSSDQRTLTSTSGQTSGTQTSANQDTEEQALEKSDATAQSCYADIEIENYGIITVYLDGEAAPITVNNFVELAKSGFYDGLTFHRIIEGFMMQGGDPNGNGTGGSDNTIVGEFTDNGYANFLSHTRGTISMARSSAYNSASSQFFIVHEDSTFLDGQYAAFGYVTEGMDVVDKVCADAVPIDGNGLILSDEQPVITSITIREAEGE